MLQIFLQVSVTADSHKSDNYKNKFALKISQRPFLLLLSAGAAIAAWYSQAFWASSRLLPIAQGDAVVVTGSSSGIGKHAALSLARDGYVVFACVRKTEDGEALVRSAERFGIDSSKVRPLILDVTNSKQISEGVETVASFVGERGLKGLFNNAGIASSYGPGMDSTAVEHMDMTEYRKVYDVNFFGLVETTKSFLELLRRGKGRIVMNTSVAGYIASPFMSAYASSKHAVEGFSDALRRELRPHGVKVSVIEPGYVATPILSGYIPEGKEPYSKTERSFWKMFWKDSVGAPSPKVTSDAVLHAMRDRNPKTRYVVGKDAIVLKILKLVPASWIDPIVEASMGQADQFGIDELNQLLKDSRTEFVLE